ncbi:sigma-54 interaction domain-containing protein [Desulfotruncus arcticus]|nr:sigma 54-interacting transcriptional regulator [Desulfotruncus arcticus]
MTANRTSGRDSAQKEEDTCGIWITDGKGYNVGASRSYEMLSGLEASDFIGLHMSEMVKQKVLDQSVTLKILTEKRPVTIPQTILTNKRKLFASGTPIYDQDGNIILVVTRVSPGIGLSGKTIGNSKQIYIEGIDKVVATSPAMQNVLAKGARAANFDSTVLITGESGVGKEVVARLIHYLSRRSSGPFARINVGAIPEELFESELFGYRAGAFTGAAHSGKKGLVQAAQGGTLFLDEIGELPASMQVKLLHLLQSGEYLPVGAVQPEFADVRFIAATNRNLRDLVTQGKFREDLFYRLNVVPINIPPLRQRVEDIDLLINFFLERLTSKYQVEKDFTPGARSLLIDYKWPGNVRELENIVERFVVLYPDARIVKGMVEEELGLAKEHLNLESDNWELPNLQQAVQKFEKELIIKALGNSGSPVEVAKTLGIHRTTLLRKMQKYQIYKNFDT